MKPTSGAKIVSHSIDLLGLDISYWDLGGQEQYREKYFEEKHKYFIKVDMLIFVIDVKDLERSQIAINYLKEIVVSLKEFSENSKLCILFHKYDSEHIPDIRNKIEELRKKILEIAPNASFYKTSIYSPISLIRAFSDITTQLSGKPELIHNLLQEYRTKTGSASVILFDTRFLIVERLAEKGVYIKVLELVAEVFSSGIEKLEEFSLEASEITSEVKFVDASSDSNQGTVFVRILEKQPRLYLIVLTLNPESNLLTYQYLDALKEKLSVILKD